MVSPIGTFFQILSDADRVDGTVLESYARDAFDSQNSSFSHEEFLNAASQQLYQQEYLRNDNVRNRTLNSDNFTGAMDPTISDMADIRSSSSFHFPSTLPSPSYTPNLDISKSPNNLPHIFNLPFGSCFGVKPLTSPVQQYNAQQDNSIPLQANNASEFQEPSKSSMLLPPLLSYNQSMLVNSSYNELNLSNGSTGHPSPPMFFADTSDMTASAGGKISKRRFRQNGEREFLCTFANCGKKFKRSEHLKRHIRSHTGSRPYQCDICQKAFSRSDNLSQHKKTHTKVLIKDGFQSPYYGN